MMMAAVSMIKRIAANTKSKRYHTRFKKYIMNDIDTKHREAGQKQG